MTKLFKSRADLEAYLKSDAYRQRSNSGWLRVETFWEKLGRLWQERRNKPPHSYPRSYGENRAESPNCKCLPTNTLYWELSEANTKTCPVHGETK